METKRKNVEVGVRIPYNIEYFNISIHKIYT